MPLYPVACPCGSEEGWSRRAIDADAKEVECFECGAPTPITTLRPHQLAAVHGKTWVHDGVKGRYVKQAGRHFTSRKEMEAWAESRNLEPVSPTDSRWTSIKEENKEHANKDAKAEGFKDQEDRSKQLKENPLEFQVLAAEKKIDAYHDEHGSDGRQSPEEFLDSAGQGVDPL